MELDNLIKIHLANASDIMTDLTQLKSLTSSLQERADLDPRSSMHDASETTDLDTVEQEEQKTKQILNKFDEGTKRGIEYSITICPTDPSFVVHKQFQTEFISTLYGNSSQWLPFYGPWIKAFTNSAMQKRTFPKNLKGNANLMNSTSSKLITELLDTSIDTTNDFFTDNRHLSDLNSCMCLVSAYYCKTKKLAIPITYEDLIDSFDRGMEILVNDLKHNKIQGNFKIYIETDEQKQSSITPLKNSTVYKKNAFSDNKIYNLLNNNNLFPSVAKKDTRFSDDSHTDVIYSITTSIFGADIPPFSSYQWNLRSGLSALHSMVLLYLIIENSQMVQGPDRKLNFNALISQEFNNKQQKKISPFKRAEIFHFLIKNYLKPTLINYPQTSVSSAFPGMVLLSIESNSMANKNEASQFIINLTDRKFEPIFDIINQKYIFQNVEAMVLAKTKLRLTMEAGISSILSKPSPSTVSTEIMKNQFSANDDYDRLYFLVLGCIPTPLSTI